MNRQTLHPELKLFKGEVCPNGTYYYREEEHMDIRDLDIMRLPESELDFALKQLEALKLQQEVYDYAQENKKYTTSAHNTKKIKFYANVNSTSVYTAAYDLDKFSQTNPGEPVIVEMTSPGGSVFDGLALIDKIEEVKRKGHHVTTKAFGYVASMAAILLQLGNTRQMTRFSHLMIHEISSGSIGKFSELQDQVELTEKLQRQLFEILSDRSTLTAGQIKKKCARKDWWMDAETALSYGFIDEIV